MKQRTIAALRNLAERPGTEAEGKLAREILARFENKPAAGIPADEAGAWSAFRAHMRGEMDTAEFIAAMRRYGSGWQGSIEVDCECGQDSRPFNSKCPHLDRQEAIRIEIARIFPKGKRVYYNKWCYSENCPGVSTGHQADWNWLRVKFDHLKQARNIPIHTHLGFHLSTEPISREELLRTGLREGMENVERGCREYADAVVDALVAEARSK